MKHLLIIVGLTAAVVHGYAQNWNEWFRQKRTQIRYYAEQVAALEIYIELGQKGYGIYQDGLQVIKDIKEGDFELHNGYLQSLSAVKPALRNTAAGQKIPLLRGLIISTATRVSEQEYQRRVRNALLKANYEQYEEFLLLTTDHKYALDDAERLARIESIYQEMTDQYLFIKGFVYENRVLDYQRKHELNDVRSLRGTIAGDAAAHP